MITKETEQLTQAYRKGIHTGNKNKIVAKDEKKQSNLLAVSSYLIALPYGLCYGYLTYALLQFAYTLFLSSVIQAIFFVVIPTWTLIIPALMTGFIYYLIGQHELNVLFDKLFDQSKQKETSIIKSALLLLLGLFVGLFISLEFFEFLPFALPIAISIAIFGGFTHFTLFYNNAGASINELAKLFDKTGGENNIEYILDMVSLAAPILAIIHVIFITGLFHPLVFGFFAVGVSAVMVKKWMNYEGLNFFNRIYATIDSTIREYAALIIHCIGEGAIPAAAATHAGSSTGVFFAQLSGLVATSNEYFTDLHAVTGDKHYFRIKKNFNKNNDYNYLCEVSEDIEFKDIDYMQSFFFYEEDVSQLSFTALSHLNEQYNGIFEFINHENDSRFLVQQSVINYSKKKLSFIEALLGVEYPKKINYSFIYITFIFVTLSLSLISLSIFNAMPLALTIIGIPILFSAYRFLLAKFSGQKIIEIEDVNIWEMKNSCKSDCCNNSNDANEEGHSHGLDYKPILNYMFGLSTSFTDLFKNKPKYATYIKLFIILTLLAASFATVYFLPIGLIHQIILFPIVYGLFVQTINFTNWLVTTSPEEKNIDLHHFLSNYLNPVNWLKGMGYLTVFLVAFCIGINGGTEFVHHLSFMFAAASVVLPMIIGIFIVCALLTEGVWINDRLEKAVKPIQSFFLSPEVKDTGNSNKQPPRTDIFIPKTPKNLGKN